MRLRTFRRILSLAFKHRKTFIFGISTVFLGTVAMILEPRILGYVIDEAIIPRRGKMLQHLGLLFFSVTAFRTWAGVQQGRFFERLGQKVTHELRVALFSHLERMSMASFELNSAGRLLTRMTNDITALNEMFSLGFISILCNVLLTGGILLWLFYLNFRLGVIAASVFPFLVGAAVFFSGRLKVAYRNVRRRLARINSFLAENLSGMKTIHLFNRQRIHLKKFDGLNDAYAQAQTSSIQIFAFFQPTVTLAAGISVGLIIWFGGGAAISGDLKLGVLVTYFAYVLSLFQPVREIADKWNILMSGLASAERIFSVLASPTEFSDSEVQTSASVMGHLTGHIVFENVWFAYAENKWVLQDFSLEIPAGQKVGIVGHTGAGKSTLVRLLLRFYEPQRGRILLDGKDLKSYDKRALRASFGIVQQDGFLFSGRVSESVALGDPVRELRVEGALREVGFSRGGDTQIEERGANLSMGERQRIAFARTQVAGPQIWILDEATAHMDSDAEKTLQACLDKAARGHTCIFIAHRLNTVKSADQIVVLHQGVLAERGSHEELLFQDGLYARLHRYQYAHFL